MYWRRNTDWTPVQATVPHEHADCCRDLSGVRVASSREHPVERLPHPLVVPIVPFDHPPESWRLLHLLFVW